MPLTAGQSLSFYEILGSLGAGGMGEVYRAKDTRLEREVAIKVLPGEMAEDKERLRRFEREAKTLASLNHTNIAGIHGVDQEDDVCFLALELVPGEDLATRLARGPLAVDEAIDVCRQIAEGLEAAHEAGVVHRDLKPANVRVTPEGVVKILDFGLAKPIHPMASKEGTASAESDSFLVTEEGLVLGTPTYMSPEQARGKPVDRRTDIWAFGCVLYECLTGVRAFEGETYGDVIAAVLGSEPDWARLPALPARVHELLRRTLTRDPLERLRDIGEARFVLRAGEQGARGGTPTPLASPAWRTPAFMLVASALAATAGVLVGRGWGGPDEKGSSGGASPELARRPIRAMLHEFEAGADEIAAFVSPDGQHVAWEDEGLWVRSLDELDPFLVVESPVSGLSWSPDSRELGYLFEGSAWRVSAARGRPARIAGSEAVSEPHTTHWADGRILIGNREGLWAVPVEGGEPEHVFQLEDAPPYAHWHVIRQLPDGRAFGLLHDTAGLLERAEIFNGNERELLLEMPGKNIHSLDLAPDGLLVLSVSTGSVDGIYRASFSLEEARVLGEPELLVPDGINASLSREGTLVYIRSGREQGAQQLAWFDPATEESTPLGSPHPRISKAALSPDGSSILINLGDFSRSEWWDYDVDRGFSAPLLTRDGFMGRPLWLPDGRIAFLVYGEAAATYAYAASGRGEEERIWDGRLTAVSPDGKYFAVQDAAFGPEASSHIVGPGLDGPVLPYLHQEDDDRFLAFSPQGDWMAYLSDRTGQLHLYLSRFPPRPDEEWPIAPGGPSRVWFREDQTEIVYAIDQESFPATLLYRVSWQHEPEVRLGVPEVIFETGPGLTVHDYDGDARFLVSTTSAVGRSRLYLDTGWVERD